jgi:transposase
MDQLSPTISNPKRRRRYSDEFKARVVRACDDPGQSVAGVARQHDLNANLLHKWRKQFEATGPSDFIRLPAPGVPVSNKTSGSTIRIDLPGDISVHWPKDDMTASVVWLQALMPWSG